jgi:hypothetical protein
MGSETSRHAGALLLAVALTSLVPARTLAQSAEDRATARALVAEAEKKLESRDFQAALELFQKAHALVPAPTLKVAMARAMASLGRIVEAEQLFREAARSAPQPNEPTSWATARERAAKEVQALEGRIPYLEISISGVPPPGIRLFIDGTEVNVALLGSPRAMNPGSHVVRVEAAGHAPAEQRVTVNEGQRERVSLALEKISAAPTSPGPPSPKSTSVPAPARDSRAAASAFESPLVISGLVAFGVFGVAGGVTGWVSKSKVDEIEKSCQLGRCPPWYEDDADDARALGTISTVSFALAGAGLGVAAFGFLTHDDRTSVSVGYRSVAFKGSF